jgi:hypothetical protein
MNHIQKGRLSLALPLESKSLSPQGQSDVNQNV